MIYYSPQRSCEGYVFTPVILFTGGGGGFVCAIPACIAGGIPACLAAGLQGGACSRGGPAQGGSAPGGCLLRGGGGGVGLWRPSPPKADGYCCGRYASYWNVFLFILNLLKMHWQILEIVKLNIYLIMA